MRFYTDPIFEGAQLHPRGYQIMSSGGRYLGALGVIYDAVLAQRIVELLNADDHNKREERDGT